MSLERSEEKRHTSEECIERRVCNTAAGAANCGESIANEEMLEE